MIHYFSHIHAPSYPHLRCLIDSIRKFDQESPVHVVCDSTATFGQVMDDYIDTAAEVIPYPTPIVEMDCKTLGIDWTVVRKTRSERDVAWTMQACLPLWMMSMSEVKEGDLCVYVDSDVFFFTDFTPILKGLPEEPFVFSGRHHFPPGKENDSAGKWNNGLMVWRNQMDAAIHAKSWATDSINRWEPHEQKLLDGWAIGGKFADLPPECDVGPWRAESICCLDDHEACVEALDSEGGKRRWNPIQSYHFHEFRRGAGKNPVTINGQPWNLTNYDLPEDVIETVYEPYKQAMARYV